MAEKKEIHCWKCGRSMRTASGDYEYEDKFLGRMSIPAERGELLVCDCGEAPYVSASLAAKRELHVQKRIEQLLLLSVGGDMHEFKSNLVGMAELEKTLGITRQAIGKSPKYRNRIYHIEMNGELLWWKPSVELFREKGDGRFVFRKPKAAVVKRLKSLLEVINGFLPPRSAAMFTF